MDHSNYNGELVPDGPAPDGCCCWALWSSITAAGQRGLTVVLEGSPDGLRFWLQSRAVDFKDEEKLRAATEASQDLVINIVASRGILYCPWCGKGLDDVVATAPAAFTEFAEAHRDFAPPSI